MNNNTHDLVALASEVLDDELGWEAKPGDTMHREDIEALHRLANTAPTLARAVIDLTNQVKRMDALAERLNDVALRAINHPEVDDDLKAHAHADRDIAARIRSIPNGETND